jgi:hypothetical protein
MSIHTAVELDVHTLDQVKRLVGDVALKVASKHFDDSTTYPQELAIDVEAELIAALAVESPRQNKLSSLVGGNAVYRAGEIKELLKDVPDDRMILSQIVGAKTGVYNAYIEMGILNNGAGPVVMSAGHPELAHLSMCTDVDERNQKIDRLIEELNNLR